MTGLSDSRELADWKAALDAHAIVATTDARGRITYVNDKFCVISKWSRAELLGRDHRIINSGHHPKAFIEDLWQTIQGGRIWKGELKNRAKDGSFYWVDTTIVPFLDAQGKPFQYIAIRAEITARKESEAARAALEEQLRESRKIEAMGILAWGIAHDFNNALAAILGNVELARLDIAGNPGAMESLDEIEKAGTSSRELVQQILAFSRRQAAAMEPTSLGAIVEECSRLLRATLPARISLDIQCEPGLPKVLGNAGQIQQVLINLGTNAMQAIGGVSGRISMRLERTKSDKYFLDENPELQVLLGRHPGGVLQLVVTDTGSGMDNETRQRIFEPFFTTKRIGEGTGLGLSVVHGIVRSHHGEIIVHSEPGKGTTFTVYLPAAEAQVQAASAHAGKTANTAPGSARAVVQHILYLDDDGALVGLVRRLLERRGWRVSAFVNQEEALAALRADPGAFDLVVSDYNMPGLSGLDIAREVRNLRSDLPVVIASGFVDEELEAEAKEAGVREVIFKAEAMQRFCDVIAGVLAKAAPAGKST